MSNYDSGTQARPKELKTIRAKSEINSETRLHPRSDFRTTVRVLVLSAPLQVLSMATCDLSQRGIGLIGATSLKIGDEFIVVFRRQASTLMCHCRVRNVRWMESRSYRTGAQFIHTSEMTKNEEALPFEWLGLKVDQDGFWESAKDN